MVCVLRKLYLGASGGWVVSQCTLKETSHVVATPRGSAVEVSVV